MNTTSTSGLKNLQFENSNQIHINKLTSTHKIIGKTFQNTKFGRARTQGFTDKVANQHSDSCSEKEQSSSKLTN